MPLCTYEIFSSVDMKENEFKLKSKPLLPYPQEMLSSTSIEILGKKDEKSSYRLI
jgi:hypothetical protein